MSTAVANPTEKVLAAVKGLGDRMDKTDRVLEDFLKVLKEPAKQAGLSPEAFLAKMTNNGAMPITVGSDGAMLAHGYRHNQRKGIGMGPMLRAIAKKAKPDIAYISEDECVKTFKELDLDQLVTKAALAESSGTTGGYTVPPAFANQLLMLAIEESIIRPRATIMPMTTLTLHVPSLDMVTTGAAGQSPYLGGVVANWTSEAATRTESDPKFRQTELKAWELSFYTVASNNILADNAVSLDSVLTNLFSAAIAWYTDYAYLRGDGVGKPQGILGAPACVSVNRSGTGLQFADVGAMMSRFFIRGDRSSCLWVGHQSIIQDLFGMIASATGHPVFIPFNQGAQWGPAGWPGKDMFGLLAGLPFAISEKLPVRGTRGDVMLIDVSKYLLGDRAELQIEVSPHFLFTSNQMVWRCVWRGDGQPWLSQPITQADGSASYTVSPFCALN